uniref:adhesion G-protein coupled receptor G7 n=1 Tax=Monopterus albus TaxID=43700 RepID=UPI0009B36804|nr:adhesion G-protein coupled receptor G7 [Monopterus albus]
MLNASVPDSPEENSATLGLTLTLDKLSVNLSSSLNTSHSQVVQPNLVVQSAHVPAAGTQGVQFTCVAGTSGHFVDNRIQLNTNTSTIVVGSGSIADALMYVRFPPVSEEAVSSRQQPSDVSLGFVLYQNNRFFRSRLYRTSRATVRVLSASIEGRERSAVPQHVEMLFRPTVPSAASLHDFACVFWDYSLQDWSTVGCSKGNASDGVLRCFCNHTTNFAALWSFTENYEYAQALEVISIVGLCFSILGLLVTIIHHVRENLERKPGKRQNKSTVALLCMCVSLLAFIITFLSGVENSNRQGEVQVEISQTNIIPGSDQHVHRDHGSCSAVAALLHFFLLATFMWNGVFGTEVVLLVRTLRRSLPPYWTPGSMAVGWGVPAVIMLVTLGATYSVDNPLEYRQEEFCWLAALDKSKHFDFGKPMFWGFLLPVALILIYNIVLLALISLTTCRTDPDLASTKPSPLRKKFLISFSLAVVLGLSWTLGYLVLVSTGHTHLVFSIVFCICTTTQGFQIFILFTARRPSFRAAVSHSVQHLSSVSIPLHSAKYMLWKSWGTTRGSTECYRDLSQERSFTSKEL